MKKDLIKSSIGTACLLMLSGCAAIAGMQEPVTPADFTKDQSSCPSHADLDNPRNTDPSSAGLYRDEVIAACIKAIDRHYAEFKASLHRESASANLATDIVSLGLSGGASVAGGGVARGLSAGSAFVSGTGKSINKDVFFDMTLPAIEASMDAGRSHVLKGIVDAQRSDSTGRKYTLARAGYDIDAYEAAGNLYVAISQLTKTASAAAEAAQADVAASQQGKVI